MVSTKRLVFKLFSLFVMLAGLVILFPDDLVKATSQDECFATYDSCKTKCDDPNQTPPSERINCGHECFFNYGICTNTVFFEAEGRTIGELEETQQIPDINAYRMCMSTCHHCPLLLPEEPVTEEDEVCVDTYVACKIDCLAALNQ